MCKSICCWLARNTKKQRLQGVSKPILPGLDIPIAILNCEDVILHKLIAGRIIDRADAAMLLRGESRRE